MNMKVKELQEKSIAELQTLLMQQRAAVQKFSFDNALTAVKNHRLRRHARKDVARILTILHARTHMIDTKK